MSKKKFIICHVANWDDFFKLAQFMESEELEKKWFYRGQSDASWKLQTSYERMVEKNALKEKYIHKKFINEKTGTCEGMIAHLRKIQKKRFEGMIYPSEGIRRYFEHLAISNFKKDAFRYVQCESEIEWLTAMQHYGTPTRLLDITSSLFAALYFAFENDIYLHSNLKPKCIWAFKQYPLWKNQPEIHKMYIPKRGSLPNDDWDDVLEDFHNEYLHDEFTRANVCLDIAESRMKKSPNEIVEMDVKSGVIPIIPMRNNERISAQNGLFLFPMNLSGAFEENLRETMEISIEEYKKPKKFCLSSIRYEISTFLKDASLIKIVFDQEKCYSAAKILRAANLSSKNLFPDLIGIAKNIRYNYLIND